MNGNDEKRVMPSEKILKKSGFSDEDLGKKGFGIDTFVLKLNPNRFDSKDLERPAEILKSGGLVAFPTETVYGLGGSALMSDAAKKIYIAKGRPQDNPLIVHISAIDTLYELTLNVPERAKRFIKKFWPGPLTLIFKKNSKVPDSVTAGLDSVAIRMPSHPIARELIRLAGPIAAPSANLSGKPSPTNARHVLQDLNGRVECIIDGGDASVGVESTVLDVIKDEPVLLRPGGISFESLKKVNPSVRLHESIVSLSDVDKPACPGMKYKHYAPKAQVMIINSKSKKKILAITYTLIKQYKGLSKKIGILTYMKLNVSGCMVIRFKRPKDAAHMLFGALRNFDSKGVEVIIAHGIDVKGIGLAFMNRLTKAAGYNIINL